MAKTNNRTCIVYALASSEDGVLRYVGQTSLGLKYRVRKHVSHAKRGRKTHRDCWIRKVLSEGHQIVGMTLESDAIWNDSEIWWIASLRLRGAKLVNSTAGGEGTIDPEDSLREKISASVSGLWEDPDYRRRQSTAHKGRPWSPARRDACEAVSAEVRSDRARRGRMKLSPDRRSQISSAAALAGAEKRRADLLARIG